MAKRINPHIGPLPIVIPLKLFLERITFPAEDISSRVAWKFRGGIKVQKHVGRAKVAMNAKQEKIKRVYPLLVGNDNRFLRVFSLFEQYFNFLVTKSQFGRSNECPWSHTLTLRVHEQFSSCFVVSCVVYAGLI